MRYVILEKCPFPGYWQALSLCWIQDAEYQLKFNKRHYYERCEIVGELYTYDLHDANRIIDYWQQNRPYAEYRVMGYPVV